MSSIKRYIAVAAITTVSVAAMAPAAGAVAHQRRQHRPNRRRRRSVQDAAQAGQAGRAGPRAQGQGPADGVRPNDAAFAKVPKATLAALAHNRKELRAVLLYHVLKGRITAAKLGQLRKTLSGQSLRVRVKNGVVTVGAVRVIKTNIAASNGVIHVIDGVLIPH